jgi:hypothetical protein
VSKIFWSDVCTGALLLSSRRGGAREEEGRGHGSQKRRR